MADGVDPSMKAMEPVRLHSAGDRALVQTGIRQLIRRDQAVLPLGDRRNRAIGPGLGDFLSHNESKSSTTRDSPPRAPKPRSPPSGSPLVLRFAIEVKPG
jgi:hypothetical protein